MRLQEIENEAQQFDREDECYVHIERCRDSAYGMIVTGDLKVVLQGLFNLMITIEDEYDFPFKEQMKYLKQGRKLLGRNDKNKYRINGEDPDA